MRTCPTGARHFGDLSNPQSAVSRLVEARGGYALMPEIGTGPVNRYLPPRKKGAGLSGPLTALVDLPATGLAGWLDRLLGKL